MMNAIEAYIQFTPDLISDDGTVSIESTETFLRNYVSEFSSFVERVPTVYPRTTWHFGCGNAAVLPDSGGDMTRPQLQTLVWSGGTPCGRVAAPSASSQCTPSIPTP